MQKQPKIPYVAIPAVFLIQLAGSRGFTTVQNPEINIQVNFIQRNQVRTEEVHMTTEQVEINTHHGEDSSQ